MSRNGIGGHTRPYQGRSDNWLTPKEIVSALGPFYLDPCASPSPRPWETAKHSIEPPSDGLFVKWKGRVWMNPPYGPQTEHWLKKLVEHGNGIALVFARTETKMFQKWIWDSADAILFLYDRLYFYKPNGEQAAGNSGGPSCLVAYGYSNVKALAQSGIAGALVQKWLV